MNRDHVCQRADNYHCANDYRAHRPRGAFLSPGRLECLVTGLKTQGSAQGKWRQRQADCRTFDRGWPQVICVLDKKINVHRKMTPQVNIFSSQLIPRLTMRVCEMVVSLSSTAISDWRVTLLMCAGYSGSRLTISSNKIPRTKGESEKGKKNFSLATEFGLCVQSEILHWRMQNHHTHTLSSIDYNSCQRKEHSKSFVRRSLHRVL